jgi:hypothetical protein
MMRLQTRTSERICGVPEYEAYDLGFRCAATLPAPHPAPATDNRTDDNEEQPNGDHP